MRYNETVMTEQEYKAAKKDACVFWVCFVIGLIIVCFFL